MVPKTHATELRGAKHARAFRKILKGIEKDLQRLGAHGLFVSVSGVTQPGRGWLSSLLRGPGYGETEEVMVVSTELHGCDIEVAVPMGREGFAPPYSIRVLIPVPMTGTAELRKGVVGKRWHLDRDDKARVADLKRTLPSVKMKQTQVGTKLPVQVDFTVPVGYSLRPTGDGNTEWTVHAGYEGSRVAGRERPWVGKYLKAIPDVEAMLRRWAEGT
jgi:hypothetical protein